MGAGRDPAYDYMANRRLLEPATPIEVEAFVMHVGNLFTQAHTLNGTIAMAEPLPPLSGAVLDRKAMKDLPDLGHWQTGRVQYSPPIGEDGKPVSDPDLLDVVALPSVTISLRGAAMNPHGSRIERGLTLVPSLADEQQPMVHTSSMEIDPKVLEQLKGFSAEDISRALARLGSADEAIAEEERLQELLGLRQDVITRLELKQLGRLATASIRPETARVDKKPPKRTY